MPMMPPTQGPMPDGVLPPGGPPTGPPSPAGGTPNPPAGPKGSLLQMILAFLAGVGAKPMSDMMQSLLHGRGGGRGSKGGDMNRPHQGGVKVQADPSNPGGAGMTPTGQQAMGKLGPQELMQLLQALAARQGGNRPPAL